MRVIKQEKYVGNPHSPEPVDSSQEEESSKQGSRAQDWELKHGPSSHPCLREASLSPVVLAGVQKLALKMLQIRF